MKPSELNILIATPAYGGMFSMRYVEGLLETVNYFRQNKINYGFIFLQNESLIPRGRNQCVTTALHQGYSHILFIDADMGWTWRDIHELIQSGHAVVGGTYPVKTLPLCLNFNALPEHKEMFQGGRKSLEDFAAYKKLADENGEIEVEHLPTGFMLINTLALRELIPYVESYQYYDITKKQGFINYEFFPIGVHEGQYESEDWAFCRFVREHGMKVYLNVNVITSHTGTYIFDCKDQSNLVGGAQ